MNLQEYNCSEIEKELKNYFIEDSYLTAKYPMIGNHLPHCNLTNESNSISLTTTTEGQDKPPKTTASTSSHN